MVVKPLWCILISAVILEKIQPEARKETKSERSLSSIWGKNKRNSAFSYFAVFRMSFWEVCFTHAEVNVEAVKRNFVVCGVHGIYSCWPPEAEDVCPPIGTYCALILYLIWQIPRTRSKISHTQHPFCIVQNIFWHCPQYCSIAQ